MQKPIINPPLTQVPEGIKEFANDQSVLESSFVQMVVGRPGSGKTYYIDQLLTNPTLYSQKFDFHLIISPSEFPSLKSGDNSCKSLDIQWLFNKLSEIKQKNVNHNYNVLVILDDVASQIKDLEKDTLLNNLFLNRRHILPNAVISIIIVTQKYNLVPLRFRTVATSLILFDINNKEFECIRNEHLKSVKEANEIKSIMTKHTSTPHNFIFMRFTPNFKLFQNFKPVLLSEQLMQEFVTFKNQSQQLELPRVQINHQVVQNPQPVQSVKWDKNEMLKYFYKK